MAGSRGGKIAVSRRHGRRRFVGWRSIETLAAAFDLVDGAFA